jgi:GNAT superfamily N-acetyltransferase
MRAGLPHCWMTLTPSLEADRDLKADPGLVETWVHGWSLTREVAPPVRDSGALRVDVGWPEQKQRYVFDHLSADVQRLAKRIDEPWILIKVCAPWETVQPILPSRWVIPAPGFMMSRTLQASSEPVLPTGYAFDLDSRPPITVAYIKSANGEIAASGRLGLVNGSIGRLAVFDRIRTHDDHRRRGLARALMTRLGNIALADGVTRAALVATPDGRLLYSALGWQLHSLYTTALIPGPMPAV